MINLSENQIEFIEKEFNVSRDQLENIEKKDWADIKQGCFDIILDETLDENDNFVEGGDETERFTIASSLVNFPYKNLKGSHD